MWRWTPRPARRPRRAADPRPGPRELRGFALDIERGRPRRCSPTRATSRSVTASRCAGSSPARCRSIRCPTGLEMRPGHAGDRARRSSTPTTRRSRTTGATASTGDGDFVARFRGPDVDTRLWRVAWDGDEVAGVVMNAIFRGENEALGDPARLARPRVGPAAVARPRASQRRCARRRSGRCATRAWTRPGWASTGRTRRARSSCTRASGSRSRGGGRRTGGRWTGRRRPAGRGAAAAARG